MKPQYLLIQLCTSHREAFADDPYNNWVFDKSKVGMRFCCLLFPVVLYYLHDYPVVIEWMGAWKHGIKSSSQSAVFSRREGGRVVKKKGRGRG